MSKHECSIVGSVTLKSDVTSAHINQVLSDFLDKAPGFIAKAGADESAIELDGLELYLSLSFRCYGGINNDFVLMLKAALNPVVDGGDYLIQLDPDSGDPDDSSLPVFLGATLSELQYAQKRFACDEMVKWLEPVVSSAHLAAVTELIFADFDTDQSIATHLQQRLEASDILF